MYILLYLANIMDNIVVVRDFFLSNIKYYQIVLITSIFLRSVLLFSTVTDLCRPILFFMLISDNTQC